MAKEFECRFDGCHATFQAETEREVLSRAEKHASQSHLDPELDGEAVEAIRSGIVDI